MELVATTAPGLDDLLVLGRIKAFENERPNGVIIVDGPAAGHALDLVRAPVQLKRAIGSGPISQQADEVLTMLSDPARCKVMLVTTAAITPVTETCEAAEELMEKANIALAPVVVNKCNPEVPRVDEESLLSSAREAYRYLSLRAEAQSEAIGVLSDSLEQPQLQLTQHHSDGTALINAVAEDLEHAIRDLS
jgi:anion-transporting  ArsA/GET3 family ATPase